MTDQEIRNEYRKRYASRSGSLVFDGIVNKDAYQGILFLLKEANQEGEISSESVPLNDWLNASPPASNIWYRAAEWVYAICHTNTESLPAYASVKGFRSYDYHAEIRKTAVINVNKADGTGSPKKEDIEHRLTAAVEANADLLRQEIENASPRIIVCGNTFRYLQRVFPEAALKCDGWDSCTIADLGTVKNVLIISHCHPAARTSALMSYYGISGIYQQALRKKMEEITGVKQTQRVAMPVCTHRTSSVLLQTGTAV